MYLISCNSFFDDPRVRTKMNKIYSGWWNLYITHMSLTDQWPLWSYLLYVLKRNWIGSFFIFHIGNMSCIMGQFYESNRLNKFMDRKQAIVRSALAGPWPALLFKVLYSGLRSWMFLMCVVIANPICSHIIGSAIIITGGMPGCIECYCTCNSQ